MINDHILTYFNKPADVVKGDARCLIPLQNLRVGVSEIDDPTHCTFQIVDSNGGQIKTVKAGQAGHHTRLVLRSETREDCAAWKLAIQDAIEVDSSAMVRRAVSE